jgi:signal transduction histidine kinase
MPENLFALLPYILSLLLSLAISAYAWRNRQLKGVLWYALYALSQAVWIFGYIFEMIEPTLGGKIFWDNVQYIGTLGAVSYSVLFVLAHVEHPLANARWIRNTLLGVSVGFLALAFTNDAHQLVGLNYNLVPQVPFDYLDYDFGTVAWVFNLSLLALFAMTTTLLTRHAISNKGIYRTQTLIILAGLLVPTVSGFSSLFGFQLSGQRDIAPITFGIGNMIVAWGLFRHKLFNLAPIARGLVLDSLDVAFYVFDTEARLVDANPYALRLLAGYTGEASPIGKKARQLFISFGETFTRFARADQAHEPITLNDRHFDMSILPINNTQGQLVGRVLMLNDITALTNARRSLEATARDLQQANEELTLARDEARKADLAKSQFLASMSHELRTPLNAILNFTEFVSSGMMGAVNERQVDALTKSLSSAKHLLSLINDVLDMSKIEAGMMVLFVEENVNLRLELITAAATMEPLAVQKALRLVTEIDDDLPTLTCDRRRVRQVLLNLLSNAIKFTEEGSITLSAKRTPTSVVMRVTDTGPGIPADKHTVVFEPFQQTDTGIRHAGGTGLGLPITKHIVQAHGGTITLESDSGKGATFTVTLPLVNATSATAIDLSAEN